MAVTEPDRGANGISAFVVYKDDPGFAVGAHERKMGIKGSPTIELYFEDCRIPGDRIIGEPGTSFKTALATRPDATDDRGTGGRHRPGCVGRSDRIRQGAQAGSQTGQRFQRGGIHVPDRR